MADRRRNRRKRNTRNTGERAEHFFDYTLLFIVIFLLGFGLVMLYSVSSYDANLEYGDSAYYLKSQARATLIGLTVMIVVAFIDYRFWEKFAVLAYITSIVLVLLVLVPGLSYSANGATRWIRIGGFSLQTAEVAKAGMILFFSSLICKLGGRIRRFKVFLLVMALAAVPAGLIYFITSNLSSAIIVMGIVTLMLFVASPDYKKFVLTALVVGVFATIVVLMVAKGILPEEVSYRLTRIKAWLNPEAFSTGSGFQTLQALYAIGSGGIFGKGLGQSMQKLGFLPEAQNDMIFSIICEELGLFGAFAVILLFVILIWRFMVIANNATDLFGALMVVGVLAHFAIQVILNIAVVTNSIPNTGITLPFISFGGSSTMFLLIEIGLVLSVSRGIRLEK